MLFHVLAEEDNYTAILYCFCNLLLGPICGFGDNEGCEQLLIQTNDGLCLCSCSDGFILHEDKKTCISS